MALLPLSLVLITHNEARHLEGCLKSVPFAAERIILDSGSTDGTVEIARRHGARIVERPFTGFASTKNAVIERAGQPWVLLLDADERLTPELEAEIRARLADPGPAVAFRIPRHNFVFGRLTRGAGWYPDYQIRLFRHGRARYDPQREVHEVLRVQGPVGTLEHPLVHINYETWAEFRAKQRRYARLHAGSLAGQGIRAKPWSPLKQGLQELWRRWIVLAGWREGLHGLRLCLALAYYEGLAYWWLLRGRTPDRPTSPDADVL